MPWKELAPVRWGVYALESLNVKSVDEFRCFNENNTEKFRRNEY